ncbi:MAG: hypothetical protein HQK77_16985 [Desulfobacterales bacterium]|nr:hypothetical protein [Desulfobacterales bacterium]
MNGYQKIIVIVLDILLLAEVCISIFLGNQDPNNFDGVIFIESFFGMSIPTFLLAKYLIRRFETPEIQQS